MPPYLAVILAALLSGMVVGITVAYAYERRARRVAEAQLAKTKEQRNLAMDELRTTRLAVTDLQNKLANVARAKNKLYTERLEDVQSSNVQAALRLARAEEDLAAARRILRRDGDGQP